MCTIIYTHDNKEVNFMQTVLDWIVFVLTGHGNIARQGVDAEILSFEGQGRDKHGK